MKLRRMSFIILACGLALFTGSFVRARLSKEPVAKIVEPRSFVIHYLLSRSRDENPPKPYGYEIRSVSSSGEWKETKYLFDGAVSTLGATRDGLYSMVGDSKQYYGVYDLEKARSIPTDETSLRSDPAFTRVEQLLGLTTYVAVHRNGKEAELEVSHAVETGITPLKVIIRGNREGGSKYHDVKEAINIEFRNLSDDEIRLPNLPIKFELAEQRYRLLKNAGHIHQADILQEAMGRLKAIFNQREIKD